MPKVKLTDKDKGYRALFKRLDKAGNKVLSVGVIDEGAAHEESSLSVGEIATIHEFGLGVPERSFIRAWVDSNTSQVEETLRKIGEAVIKGRYTSEQGLERAGVWISGQMQERISQGIPPPNAESTVARKGSSTPLIDTGVLRSAITHKVE